MPRVAYALAAAVLLASPAQAQTRVCAPTAQIVDKLDKAFGEHLAAAGLNSEGNMVGVYSNPEKGTWTITVTTPDKVSCVITSGQAFAIEMPEAPAPEEKVS